MYYTSYLPASSLLLLTHRRLSVRHFAQNSLIHFCQYFGRHFAHDIFKCIFLKEKVGISIMISLPPLLLWWGAPAQVAGRRRRRSIHFRPKLVPSPMPPLTPLHIGHMGRGNSLLPARSNAASSLEESRQRYKVSTFGSSGPRTDSGLCRGLKSLQVVPRRVLRTHFLFVINIFVRAFCFCCVLVEFFLLFLSRGYVTTWRHFCFLSAIFLSINLFFFGTLCLFVIFPV